MLPFALTMKGWQHRMAGNWQAARRGARLAAGFQFRRALSTPAAAAVHEDIVSFSRRRGFVFPGSDIYGSIGVGYDYGPLGASLKKNLIDQWWSQFITKRSEVHGLDTSIILNPAVWKASGHVDNFTDPLSECRSCHHRARVDKLLEETFEAKGLSMKDVPATLEGMKQAMIHHSIACPACKASGHEGLTEPRLFNLLFQTWVGATQSEASNAEGALDDRTAFLRPETAQGVYIHFHNIAVAMRSKLPFGVGQVGKSFRNEIATGGFLFRTREFEQMELQYFVPPAESAKWHDYWVNTCYDWLVSIGLNPENLRLKVYPKDELAHYALATTDIEYKFPNGWGELWGIANRGSWDLECHSRGSGVDLRYADPTSNEKYFPHVIEPALGLGRLFYAVLCEGRTMDTATDAKGNSQQRSVLKLSDKIAPYRAAVLPVVKKPELIAFAKDVFETIAEGGPVDFDVTGSIGRRYRRQDEIGTPVCVTVDQTSLDDGTVTLRCRDTMKQVRVAAQELQRCGLRPIRAVFPIE